MSIINKNYMKGNIKMHFNNGCKQLQCGLTNIYFIMIHVCFFSTAYSERASKEIFKWLQYLNTCLYSLHPSFMKIAWYINSALPSLCSWMILNFLLKYFILNFLKISTKRGCKLQAHFVWGIDFKKIQHKVWNSNEIDEFE